MQSRLTLLFLLSISIGLFSHSQENCESIRFQKIFRITPSSLPTKIITTRDGGYLLTGRQTEELVGNGDGLLLKLNKYGEKEWVKAYNRTDADFTFSSSAQLPDGTFITIADMHDGSAAIQKTDENGNLLWQKKLTNSIGPVTLYQVIAYDDGSFVIAGLLQQSTFEGSSIIIKFDTDGNQQWMKYWNNGNHINYPSSLLKSGDLLLVTGIIPALEPGTPDTSYLVKMSAIDGEIFLSKKFWNGTDLAGNSTLIKRTDESFVLVTDFYETNSGVYKTTFTHLNQDLNVVQQLKTTGINNSFFTASSSTNDNGISLTFKNTVNQLNYLVKFNSDFNTVFAKEYLQSIPENISGSFTTMLQTADNGFMVGGNILTTETSDIYLLKTDANGKTANCKTQSLNISTEPITLNSEFFIWNVGEINSELNQEDLSVPGITPNYTVQTLCFSTSCIPECDFSCSIKSTPSDNTYTGGNPNIIYLGYGPQSTSLSVVTSGAEILTYNWAGNGMLSCNNCANPVFTPSSPGTFQFTATITDEEGCTSECTISICVVDVRIESNNADKVYLCHVPPGNTGNPQQLIISVDAVAAHLLNHPEDKLGVCGQSSLCDNQLSVGGKLSGNSAISPLEEKKGKISIYPNPAYDHIFIKLSNNVSRSYSIKVRSGDGKIVSSGKYEGLINEIKFDNRLTPGIYFVEITIGNQREIFKVLKQK
jgi:hypothetical protein